MDDTASTDINMAYAKCGEMVKNYKNKKPEFSNCFYSIEIFSLSQLQKST